MNTFYNNYVKLCAEKGKSASGVAREIGLSNAAANGWKNGKVPSDVTLQKLSAYFDVPVSELTEEKEKAPTDEGERIPYKDKRELLAGRGVSILLDADAKLTEEQLDDIVNFIQFQQEKNGR